MENRTSVRYSFFHFSFATSDGILKTAPNGHFISTHKSVVAIWYCSASRRRRLYLWLRYAPRVHALVMSITTVSSRHCQGLVLLWRCVLLRNYKFVETSDRNYAIFPSTENPFLLRLKLRWSKKIVSVGNPHFFSYYVQTSKIRLTNS